MAREGGHTIKTLLAATLLVSTFLTSPSVADNRSNDANTCSDIWEDIGLPETEDDIDRSHVTVCHRKYIIGHNLESGTPDWVIEHLTRAIVKGKNTRPKSVGFRPEPNLPPEIPRADNKDYTGSGFDRGHQAPSADFKSSAKLMEDTFFFSNVVPQEGKGFNQGIWKRLEALVAKLAIDRGEIYVITGPIYQERKTIRLRAEGDACGRPVRLGKLPRTTIGGDNVAVPAALYKIIYDPRLNRLNAYVLPNVDHREIQDTARDLEYLGKYRVGLGTVERLTGLTFMTALDERTQRMLRRECPGTMLH
jgi:endonuclease G